MPLISAESAAEYAATRLARAIEWEAVAADPETVSERTRNNARARATFEGNLAQNAALVSLALNNTPSLQVIEATEVVEDHPEWPDDTTPSDLAAGA